MNDQNKQENNQNIEGVLRVLFIDDVLKNTDYLIRELQQAGIVCESHKITNLDKMRRELNTFVPDFIISNSEMPQFTGMEVLDIIKEHTPNMPFTFITAFIKNNTSAEFIKHITENSTSKQFFIGFKSTVSQAFEKKHLEQTEWDVQEQIKQAAHQWRTTFDAMRETVALLDTDKRILRCNIAFKKLVGKSWDQIIDQRCCFIIHGLDKSPPECPVLRASQSLRREMWQTQIGNRWFDIIADPILDENKKLIGFILILADITARKQAEAELKQYRNHLEELVEERTHELQKAQEKLVRQEKLAILGELAGGVSHELRNPIGAIKNATYFMKMESTTLSKEMRESIDIIENEISNANRIITTLLDFARPGPPSFINISINDFLKKNISRILSPENISINFEFAETLPELNADAVQLERIIDNIINNAIQAMPQGGTLTIRTSMEDKNWITIAIADTGIGIPADQLEKLFEPLYTTKAKGIGLGLSIVKTLVERHNGRIKVQSQENCGTTMKLQFPVDK